MAQIIRAALWLAVSDPRQAEKDKESLPAQREGGLAVCERQGWQVAAILEIPGHSREYFTMAEAAEDIPQYAELLRMIKAHSFDVLVPLRFDRLGRTVSLVAEVISRTVRAGARLYLINGGWVDANNYVLSAAMGGYSARQPMESLLRDRNNTLEAQVKRGQFVGSTVLFGFRDARDSRGKRIFVYDPVLGRQVSLMPDESQRRFFDDLAEALVGGTTWWQMGRVLFERGGHINPSTNRQWIGVALFGMVYSPTWWGHTARHATRLHGAWVYDAWEETPPGVTLTRNAHRAVWTGEQAERVKTALRVKETLRGRGHPRGRFFFTALLQCHTCGSNLIAHTSHYTRTNGQVSEYLSWRCRGLRYVGRAAGPCAERKHISDEDVREHFERLLAEMKKLGDPSALLVDDSAADKAQRVAELRRLIGAVGTELDAMIVEQARAVSPGARNRYTDLIERWGERLDSLKGELRDLSAQLESPGRVAQRRAALAELERLDLEHLWENEPYIVNQMLHRVMAGWQLYVEAGAIGGRVRRRRRRGTSFLV